MSRGRFITFEGGEGSGKSTQVQLLADRLRQRGHTVLTTREPGGTAVGERIRAVLLEPDGPPPRPEAELLLFMAARAQLVGEVIAPALEAGTWVLADRYMDSTTVYQAHARGLNRMLVEVLNGEIADAAYPDRTLILDLPVEVGLARAHAQQEFAAVAGGDRIEQEARAFHEAVREGYHLLAEAETVRVRLIDAAGSVDAIHDACWRAVRDLHPAGDHA